MDEFAAYLGIDWADTKHDLCLVDARTGAKTRLVIRHTPEALAEYFVSLRAQYPGRQLAVALEQSRGPLLFALLQYDFLVLFPVNPSTLARYREAFSPSRGPKMIPLMRLTWSSCCNSIAIVSRPGVPMIN